MHSRGVTATPLRVVTASPPRVCIIFLIIEWLIVNHSLLKGFPHFSNNDSKQYIVMWHKIKGQHNLHPLTPHSPTTDRPLGKSITHMPCPWESYIFSPFSLSWSCCAVPHAEFGKWASLYQFVLAFQPTVTDRPPALGLSLHPCRGWQCPPWALTPKPLCLNGHRVALSCQAAKHGSAPPDANTLLEC